MARKRDTGRNERKRPGENALSRRDFVTSGVAVGAGAAVLSGCMPMQGSSSAAQDIEWNYEADVVVLGSGCVGLHAAVRARDMGASVLVIEQNFDVGGKLVHSGGWTSLGGGDAIQERDRTAADPEGLGLTAPLLKPADLEDDPDRLFRDMTDWSVVDATGVARYRYNDRELHRAWADNAPKTRQFMMDNYIRFARIDGTHQGGGMSRGRAARSMMKMAEKTDIKAGTLSPEDRGDPEAERHSPFSPMRTTPGVPANSLGAPGWVYGGFAIARSLEFSAREKGIQFMLNRHLDELIREQQFSGRVLGVRASYTPRMHPETGARLESFWNNGNIEERAEVIHIRARKAVIVATGGMHGSVPLRTMMDPRLVEPSLEYGPSALMGPLHMDGSGIVAGMKIGANLAGMMQNYQHSSASPTISSVLGTRDTVGSIFPGPPLVPLRARQGNQYRRGRVGTRDRGEPGGPALLQRERDRRHRERCQISAGHRRHARAVRAAGLAQRQHRTGQGAIQAVGGLRCRARDERGLGRARLCVRTGVGDLRFRRRATRAIGRSVTPTSPIRPTAISTKPIRLPSSLRKSWSIPIRRCP